METGRAYPQPPTWKPGGPTPDRWKPGAQPPDGSGITLRSSARAASKASGAVDPWPIRRCVAAPRRKVASRRRPALHAVRHVASDPQQLHHLVLAKRVHPEGRRQGGKPRIHLERSFVHRSSPCSWVARSLYHRRHAEAEEPDGLRGRHRGVPRRAPDPPGDSRGLVGDAPRAGAAAVEPHEDLLARGGLHEGRPARLLLQRRPPAAPPPRATAADDEADAQRDGRRVLLREDRAVAHARLGASLHGAVARTRRKAGSTTSRSTTSRRCCSSRTSGRSRCTRCTPAAATRSTRTTCSSTSTRSRPTPTRTCSPSRGT